MLSPSLVSVVSDPGSPAVVSVDEVAEVREVVRRARRESVDVLVYLVEKGVGIMKWNMCGIKTSEWEGGQAEINSSYDFSLLSRRASDCRKSGFHENVREKEEGDAEDRGFMV